jgi:UDPglucose 6-dehydrogenase
MKDNYSIVVVGAGYVGLSNAVLLSQKQDVFIYDLNQERIEQLNQRISPIHDAEIIDYLENRKLNLKPIGEWDILPKDIDLFVIATPTDYNPDTNYFDTSSIELTLEKISSTHKGSHVIIKSTIPIGFTSKVSARFTGIKISFAPEFLREGKALLDNLYPSRIVMGSEHSEIIHFSKLWQELSLNLDVPVILTKPKEAESIKLFANSYLAMRVAYFNELDSFAELNDLNTKDIVDGIGADPRIGNHYNNPSFGYGGYCFPKDTKQLRASFNSIPEKLISAIVESNETRKQFVLDQILKRKPKVVGIYRLVMKVGSDNFRESAIISIMNGLLQNGIEVIVYEPLLDNKSLDYRLINEIDDFAKMSNIIIANRIDDVIKSYSMKVYSRDLFQRD